MPTPIEPILNQALRRIGYPTPIGFIYEGSRASRVAVEIYGQTRDDLLRSQDWDFARSSETLALLKQAPVGGYSITSWTSAYPPPPWIYEYAYPTGCLQIRALRPTPAVIPSFYPVPHNFVLANDDVAPATGKVVLTNLAKAIAVFTEQVVDPTQWEASFSNALIEALSMRFAEALSPNVDVEKLNLAEKEQAAQMAGMRRG